MSHEQSSCCNDPYKYHNVYNINWKYQIYTYESTMYMSYNYFTSKSTIEFLNAVSLSDITC